MNLNISLGTLGSIWLTVAGPQLVLNVFYKNVLGASSASLGLLVAVTQVASAFNLLSIFLFARLKRVKPFWMVTSLAHRLYGFVPAAVCLYVLRGGAKATGAQIILLAIAVSWALANASASGWLKWLTDIVPEDIRATFFGRRSAVINVVTMVWFLLVTIALDLFRDANIYLVYFVIFAVAGVAGMLDIILAVLVPEPRLAQHGERAATPAGSRTSRAADFLEPLRNRNFIGFSLSIGLWLFSVNVLAPFVPPYITSARGIGAPNIWLGIMTVLTQLTYVATSTSWGMVMDRFGRKPVVLLGSLYPLVWIGYFFLSPGNFMILLPVTALLQGLLSPAFTDGSGQLMLTLTPQRNRTAYVAWYSAIAGIVPAGGALIGGVLDDAFEELHLVVAGVLPVGGFQIVTLLCFFLCILSFLILSRIREGREKPMGFVLARIMTPNVFRTFLSINVLGRGEARTKVARALRTMEGRSGAIAVSDIITRLDDPDGEVREEAAHALGRIGSTDAVEPLIGHLRDPRSPIRPQAARALGRIADSRAVQPLIECLGAASEELLEACCQALGRMRVREALKPLTKLFGEERSPRVLAAAGEAMSRLGSFEAALDILPRMHAAESQTILRQYAMAMGNLMGRPGEFYAVLTGDSASRAIARERLEAEAQRTLQGIVSRTDPRGGGVDGGAALASATRRVRESFAAQDDAGLVEAIHDALLAFTALLAGRALPEEEALAFAFLHSARLGLGLWFTSEIASRLERLRGTAALEIDALLAAYFLAAYRELPDGE